MDETALRYYQKGRKKADVKMYQEAVEAYSEVIRPGYSDAYFQRGNAKRDMGDCEQRSPAQL